jgi:hypothetical protein
MRSFGPSGLKENQKANIKGQKSKMNWHEFGAVKKNGHRKRFLTPYFPYFPSGEAD